ncbi:MAG: hypothetical protein PHU98_06110 [Mariniphaga sp.]|nr:hypothetical protein [Mariniphaga sp.]
MIVKSVKTGVENYITQQEWAELQAKGYGSKFKVVSNEDAIFENSAPAIPQLEVKEFIAKIHQQNETAKQEADKQKKSPEQKTKRKN